jgi:hypothetical protein
MVAPKMRQRNARLPRFLCPGNRGDGSPGAGLDFLGDGFSPGRRCRGTFCCASYSPPVEQISACACGICGLFHASAIRLTFSLCDRFLCAAQAGPPGWPDLLSSAPVGIRSRSFANRSLVRRGTLSNGIASRSASATWKRGCTAGPACPTIFCSQFGFDGEFMAETLGFFRLHRQRAQRNRDVPVSLTPRS